MSSYQSSDTPCSAIAGKTSEIPLIYLDSEQLQRTALSAAPYLLSLGGLYDLPDETHSFVVEDLLPTAGSSILSGKPKAGKSTLARQLLLAVASGTPFLGRRTLQGAGFYFALEEKESEIKRHFEEMGASRDLPIHLYRSFRVDERLKALDRIREIRPTLVVIDTLAKFTGISKLNDYGPVNLALTPIHQAARDSGAHVVLVHHVRKTEGEDVIDDPNGSTALSGAVDTLISLRGKAHERLIATRARYGIDIESSRLSFDKETKTFQLGSSVSEVEDQRREAVQKELRDKVVLAVKLDPGLTESEIMAQVQGNKKAKQDALRDLLKDSLRRTGRGVAGDPYKYFADVPVEAGS